MALGGPAAPARTGKATSLVILLHGYGADGNDLFGLAEPLSQHLPGTAFRAPNAPERCRNNPFGFQWFPIPWLDGSSEQERDQAFRRSVKLLDDYITDSMREEGVDAAHTALVGFSQGTMMGLYVSPGARSDSPASSASRGGWSGTRSWRRRCACVRPCCLCMATWTR